MRFALFYHSLVSDWNHGNAHFLRGIACELLRRGHQVGIYEPEDGWSVNNLVQDEGLRPLDDFADAYPQLQSQSYRIETVNLESIIEDADVVIVHEWSDPALVSRLGRLRAQSGHFRLLFHDTHHRCVTAVDQMKQYDLSNYDGVLAFGEVIRRAYLDHGWIARAWTWHEAADTRRFFPMLDDAASSHGDLVWVGNWGDGERSEELQQYLIRPVERLGLKARVYGVRYPFDALRRLNEANIHFAGWAPNYFVPNIFSAFRCTVHIPRRPYREQLPGVPTIRVFEALACGIPLVCLRWDDTEGLFQPGEDYLVVDTPEEMEEALQSVLSNPALAHRLSTHGRRTIMSKHTCRHRVDELMHILQQINRSEEGINQDDSHCRKRIAI